jgi:hypothetical protein
MTLPQKLLALPAEIRCKIWRLCVDNVDDSVICCPCEARPSCKHTFSSLTAISHKSNRSCEADYAKRAIYTTNLSLIFVNKQLRDEAEHLYSNKVLKFCSRVCFADLLRRVAYRHDWIKKIEIVIDLRPLRVGFSYSSARYIEMLRDEKELLCEFASHYFSSCSFEGREIWNGFDVTGATRHEYIVTGKLIA